MNLATVGAEPLALVNCLNFGNPEHPEVMWQLSETVDGMAEASRALGMPVIGGNVSLYNETNGVNIDPSPVIGVALFAETPGAVLAAVAPGDVDALVADAGAAGVPALVVGDAGGDRLVIGDLVDVAVADAHAAWRDRLRDALGSGTAQ
jgi:hydrogenase maturation factor